MNLRNYFVIVLVLLMVALLGSTALASEQIKIGVTQIVDHPALDAARQGFIDRMTELGYPEGEVALYDIHSAQGDMSIATTIAQKFVADKVDLILAIATPTSQAAANVTSTIPILITAVTDPVAAGIVDSIEKPGGNVTGTSDLTPVVSQLRLLLDIAPGVQRVGIVYNAGEVNSVVQVDIAKEAAAELGITIVEATAGSSAEVLQAAQSLRGRVDAIYVPTCNTAVTALESIVHVAEQERIPLIAGDDHSVERGALATQGINYYNLGRQTADIAVRVLKGEDPANISIEYLEEADLLVLNLSAAERMNVQFSEELLAKATKVIEEP